VDIHDKLDELSALVEGARAMPMSASCVVNRGQVLDLLDEARSLLPTTLAHADDLLATRDDILGDAQRDGETVLEQARADAAELVSEHEVYRTALGEADLIRSEAAEQSRRMRQETDDYVDAKLANFEVALHKTLGAVQKGREKIHGRYAYDDLAEGGMDDPLPQ
jgi:cell division septum initiation protein DivIVA